MTDYPIPKRLTEIPSWLHERKDITEEKIAQDLTSLTYWAMVDKRANAQALGKVKKLPGWVVTLPLEKQDPELRLQYANFLTEATKEISELIGADLYTRARMMAESADSSFDTASELGEAMERVQTRIAIDLKEQGLLPYLEHSSVAEYLLSKRTPWSGEGERPGSHYEIAFMVDYLIPVLEANGFPRKLVIGIAENFHKARYATPYLRQVLGEIITKTNEIKDARADATTDEERMLFDRALEEAMQLDTRLKELLEALIDEMSKTAKQGGMAANAFREKMSRITRKAPAPDKMLGYVHNMPKGGVMMISVSDVKTLNALQNLTRKLVDWHLGTPEDLARMAGQQLLVDLQPDDLKEILDAVQDSSKAK